jgi:hypothetical protein
MQEQEKLNRIENILVMVDFKLNDQRKFDDTTEKEKLNHITVMDEKFILGNSIGHNHLEPDKEYAWRLTKKIRPLFSVDRSQVGNIFSIEIPFKVLVSFFEVKFKAWLTSIGLWIKAKKKVVESSNKEMDKSGKSISEGKNLIKRNIKGTPRERERVVVAFKQGFSIVNLSIIPSWNPAFKTWSLFTIICVRFTWKTESNLFRPAWQIHLKKEKRRYTFNGFFSIIIFTPV